MITKNQLLITLVVITILIVLVSGYSLYRIKTYNDTLKKTYNDRIQVIQRQLEQSRRSQDSIRTVILNLKRSLVDLQRLDSLKSSQIGSVKGSVDKIPTSELQQKMIDEYNSFIK